MNIDGACHCGEIRFTAEVDPEAVVICHCTDCQLLSGSAFRTVVMVAGDKLTLLSGTPSTYIKTAENGNRRLQTFCGTCGAPFYSCDADAEQPESYALRLGIVRQRADLVPKRQNWCRSAQSWLATLNDIPRNETVVGKGPIGTP